MAGNCSSHILWRKALTMTLWWKPVVIGVVMGEVLHGWSEEERP
jgi:hypothetical protein